MRAHQHKIDWNEPAASYLISWLDKQQDHTRFQLLAITRWSSNHDAIQEQMAQISFQRRWLIYLVSSILLLALASPQLLDVKFGSGQAHIAAAIAIMRRRCYSTSTTAAYSGLLSRSQYASDEKYCCCTHRHRDPKIEAGPCPDRFLISVLYHIPSSYCTRLTL
jgi:hypothetical protein